MTKEITMKWQGLIRRCEPLLLKIMGRLPTCPWRCVFFRLDPRTLGVYPPELKIEVMEQGETAKKLRFNGVHEAWFPASTAINPELWNEYLAVFWDHPANAHFYLSHGTVVHAGDVCLDCGSCEGFFARQALDAGAAKVICIEPNPAMATCLEKTFARELQEGRVVIRPSALGAFRGRASFGFNAAYPSFGQIGEAANAQWVSVETLADICDELKLTRVDFIKMDLEGAEIQAIEGSLPLLAKCRPKLAITTYHRPFDFVCLRTILRSVGYARLLPVGVTEFGRRTKWRPAMLHGLST